MVADIFPGGAGSSPRSFFNLEDRVYFTAEDGSGRQIWRTDGSAEGTRRITTLAGAGIEVFAWTRLDRSVYFVGSGVEGSGLWRIDDEDRVTPVAPGSYSPRLAAAGRTLVFDNGEPWKSDGTPEGTELLQDVNPYPASSRPEAAADLDGVLLFFAADLDLGRELWRSDGTSEGTTRVADIRAGRRGSIDSVAIPFMTRLGDVVYFAADDGIHGAELWRSDGTASGTYLVADTVTGPEGGLEGIYEIPPADQPEGSVVFFNARTASDESRTKRRRAGPRLMYLCDTGRDFVLPSRKVVAARLPIASS